SNQVLRVGTGLLTFHLRERVVDNLCVCNQLNPHFSSFFCCLSASTPAPIASDKKTASAINTANHDQLITSVSLRIKKITNDQNNSFPSARTFNSSLAIEQAEQKVGHVLVCVFSV